jgi:DNA primase
VRKRGRAAFEKAQEAAVPLSEFLLADLAARHPPTSAEGRAALVAAARPHMAEIHAPVLAAILRRRLSELSGLPESELRGLLNLPTPPGTSGSAQRAPREEGRQGQRGASFRANVRRPPSLARELIQGLLLSPALARSLEFPRPDDGNPDSAALVALVDHCATAEGELTTAGVLQHFADSPHEGILASVLAQAEDHGLTTEMTEANVLKGLENWWQQARRAGSAAPAPAEGGQSAEEIQRLRQLQFVRQTAGEASGSTPPDDSF